MAEDDRSRDQDPAGTAAEEPSDVQEAPREEPGPEPAGAPARPTPFTQQLGRLFVIVIAVLFGIFAVVNAQFVEFNWVFGGTEVNELNGERVGGGVPLIVLLVASFVLGALAGWFATWWRGRRH